MSSPSSAEPRGVALLGSTGSIGRQTVDVLAAHRGARVHYLVGRRGIDVPSDPFNAATIARLVPDIADQDVFLCGPVDLMRRSEAALRELGVPRAQVHAERFAY